MDTITASDLRPIILVVDDVPDNLTLISELLEAHYRVRVCNRGEKALSIAKKGNRPDLILLDIMMPDTDGYAVIQTFKADPATRDIPVIFLTALSESRDEERGFQLGATDYITKPISPPILLARVRTQLALKQGRDRLERYLDVEKKKLSTLVDLGKDLSAEHNLDRLLEKILNGGKTLSHAQAATLYLRTKDNHLAFSYLLEGKDLSSMRLPLFDPDTGDEIHHYVSTHVALSGETVFLDDVHGETCGFDVSGTLKFEETTGFRTVSMLAVALKPRKGHPIGVLQLINATDPKTGDIIPFDRELAGFVEALAGQGAIAVENLRLVQAQEELFDAIIRVIAGAIDAKSPYTGGHCERVPEIGRMLGEAVCATADGPFAAFSMDDEEWTEFRLASWLHDCGKVTTPEAVVDKATKLECVFNRIHEIRTRFEVLWRDAIIAHQERRLNGEAPDPEDLDAALAKLRDDFSFIATCNVGNTFLQDADIQRLESIAETQWLRYFDDRIGLSHMEEDRFQSVPADPLPAWERVLDDKPTHIIPLNPAMLPNLPEGMKITLKPPGHANNQGEMHNLRVRAGTLNDAERYKINEHVIQTLNMLSRLPFPNDKKRVPMIAGAHHETMTGKGYPMGLSKNELLVQSRILAIADVFEALTAGDRPYKKPKSLSEALKIMSFMRNDGHIDGDLFELFLKEGIYQQYADIYLRPEQIDPVDIAKLL